MSKVKKNKKIVFDDTDIRHAKLKIRLQHDGLSQADLCRVAAVDMESREIAYSPEAWKGRKISFSMLRFKNSDQFMIFLIRFF